MSLRWKIAQAFEIRWWQQYLKNKPESDYQDWKTNYWNTFLQRNKVEVKSGERILDVGCGPAGVFIVLADQQVDAVDPLLPDYESKLSHFDSRSYPWVNFHQESFESFQTEQAYEKVFCLNAINHVADLELCFDKLVAACEKGGELIVSIDAHNHAFFKSIFRLIPGDILHPHQYDLKEYQDMLTSRGCEILRTKLYKEEFFFNYFVLVAKKR